MISCSQQLLRFSHSFFLVTLARLFQLLVNSNSFLALKPKYIDFLLKLLAIMIIVDILQAVCELMLSLFKLFQNLVQLFDVFLVGIVCVFGQGLELVE